MDSIEDFFAGWIGGIAGLVIGHPADTIKVRQQSMNEPFLKTVKVTFKYEGFFGFYKGMFAPFFTIGPSNAVFFCAYGSCLRQLQGGENAARVDLANPHWTRNVLISGSAAGFAQVMVTCPVELVKTILQVHTGTAGGQWGSHYEVPYNNTLEAVKGIFRERGIRGFYRGLAPMFWRDVPTSSIYMFVYETSLPRGDYQPLWQQIWAGGIAGVASWVCTVPFDVIKSRMQSDNPNKPYYTGMIDCFRKSLKAEGPTIFVKGFWLITARAFPVNAAILGGYETASKLFKSVS